jgi:serine/threonine-protein phosphatase 6 regulatory ankyrin repeat subunit B
MAAADLGHLETVRALLDKHADTQVHDKDGNSALALAEKYQYVDVATMLKNAAQGPRDTRKNSDTGPAPTASAKSATAATPPTPAPNSTPNSASAFPVASSDKSAAASAVSPAPALKPPSLPPVLSKSESLNKNLFEAAEAGDTAETLRLIREGAGVNSRDLTYGTTPLMGAAARGHADTVRALIDRGGEVDLPDSAGHTALMEAAFAGYSSTLSLLIAKGANVNAQDNDGWTALFWATFSRRTDSVRLLLQKGADVNARNKQQDTALIRASYGGDIDTLTVLLEHHPDLNAKDNFGRTALMEAAREDRSGAVNLLLQSGADSALQDHDGYTALSLATKLRFSRIVALLNSPREQNTQKVVADPAPPSPQTGSEGVPAADGDNANPLVTEVQALRNKSRARAFYGLGLSIRLLQSFWPQNEKEAVGASAKLLGDLREVDAPENLIALAQQTFTSLAYPQDNGNADRQPPVSELRKRLDAYCQSQTDGTFFYAVGGYSYDLNLLGQYLTTTSQNSSASDVADAHGRLLPLSTGFAAQCAAIVECKDRALGFFSNSVAILQKPTLASEDGSALREISNEIGVALGTQDD